MSTNNNRYTYTGREWDAGLSLYHYRARMYDAVAGRFVSRDPVGFEGSQWNLFEYINSRSLVYLDPHGEAIPVAAVPVIAIYAAAAATGIGVFACIRSRACMQLAGRMAAEMLDAAGNVLGGAKGGTIRPQPLPRPQTPEPKPETGNPYPPYVPPKPPTDTDSTDGDCLCCEIEHCGGREAGPSGAGGSVWGDCVRMNAAACNARYPDAACAPPGIKSNDPVKGRGG